MSLSFLYIFNFVDFLSSFTKLFVVVVVAYFIVAFFSFRSFLFPYWAVFLAGAFRFLASGSPSWGLQSGM